MTEEQEYLKKLVSHQQALVTAYTVNVDHVQARDYNPFTGAFDYAQLNGHVELNVTVRLPMDAYREIMADLRSVMTPRTGERLLAI